ncbi:AGE family epimerase/isomerase [Phenylobacterium koreense]|uniref:Mannose-6-phosphate isomerase n=1 Tax=Phenylobacterium koreense TaxID=266125 RepID=A0ABV2EM19_9CAUL
MAGDSVTKSGKVGVRAAPGRFADLAAASRAYDRWLRKAALPIWWAKGADRQQGGFIEALSVEGDPRPGPRRARVQGRQAYVYATAGMLGWDGPWREAAWHGVDFFVDRFRRPDGLFRTLVGLDGEVLDDTPMLYDQAFALLGTATLRRADPERAGELRDVALGVLDGLQSMRNPAGGYIENIAYPYQANAHMHLLEGALAWAEVEPDPWEAMAAEIIDLALTVFIDPKGRFLREFFDASWGVAGSDDGRLVEPGHQFEWAWLLARWGRQYDRADVVEAGRDLYRAGLRGIDPVRNVAVNELWDDFTLRDGTARLWPQTERLKAELLFGNETSQLAAADSLQRYLETPAAGVWRDKMRPDGGFIDEPAPATSFYHVLCACTELFRAAPLRP